MTKFHFSKLEHSYILCIAWFYFKRNLNRLIDRSINSKHSLIDMNELRDYDKCVTTETKILSFIKQENELKRAKTKLNKNK